MAGNTVFGSLPSPHTFLIYTFPYTVPPCLQKRAHQFPKEHILPPVDLQVIYNKRLWETESRYEFDKISILKILTH